MLCPNCKYENLPERNFCDLCSTTLQAHAPKPKSPSKPAEPVWKLREEEKQGFPKVLLLLLLPPILCLLFATFRVGTGTMAMQAKQEARKRFSGDLSRYIPSDDVLITLDTPFRRGKMLPMYQGEGGYILEPLIFNRLPDSLRPVDPDKVDMVIRIDKRRKHLMDYVETSSRRIRGAAYQEIWVVSVIDLIEKAVVFEKTFYGSNNPPRFKRVQKQGGNSDWVGGISTKAVLESLQNLPVRRSS